MDETIALILDGCKMAKILETNLPNMANNPQLLFSSCDEIIRVFNKVKENISKAQGIISEPHEPQPMEIAAGVQEWLRNSRTQAMDLLHAQLLGVHGLAADAKMKEVRQDHQEAGGLEEMVVQMGGRDARGSLQLREVQAPAVEATSSGSRGTPSQRQRRRRDGGNRRVERVPAPQMGNTEIPPEDGYTWRKYGQKYILNSKFPRSYFRCTHQKLYQCPAKKQVQRLDDDPDMYEVTYRGGHTCHLSSTAPSVPPPSLELRQDMINQQGTAAAIHPLQPYTTISMSQWLSMDINSRPENVVGMQMRRDFGLVAGGGGVVGTTTSSNINLAGSSGGPAAPSTSRYGKDVDYQQPVADMADAMFNSGSSSNNSMELIFSSMDDKWDSGENKKN